MRNKRQIFLMRVDERLLDAPQVARHTISAERLLVGDKLINSRSNLSTFQQRSILMLQVSALCGLVFQPGNSD